VHDTGATPHDWLARARSLERAAGRVRDPDRRFGPRTLDVDVIAVWTDGGEPVFSDDPDLTLPHPRAHLRAFVLRPWIDIQPYAQLPGHGWLTDLLRGEPVAADVAHVRARKDLTLESG
jgi:2-amino-4-hydroxy-6-hydroxymethyldihydropteridine diphosphokinase